MTKLYDWCRDRVANKAEARPWYRIQNKAADTNTIRVDIYDEISWLWGVSAVDFRNELLAHDNVNCIELHVNSPGGDVYEAIAIMNTLRQHDAKVITTVDGLAASSAGFIAVGASDELVIAENAEIMAHLPWAMTVGNAADMRKTADDLDRIGQNIASIFAARAGGSTQDWIDVLTNETWWSAQEAVDAKIADRVLPGTRKNGSASAKFDLSAFAHAGRANAPAPAAPITLRGISPAVDSALDAVNAITQTPLPQAEVTHQPNEGEGHMPTFTEGLAALFGLEPDADEDTILAAATEALAERAEDTPAEPTIDEATKVAAKFGMTVVNKAQFDQMTATVADLSARRDAQIKAENEAAIHNALASGAIDGPVAEIWRKSLETNREATLALMATLPANKAVPVDEIGHGVSREDQPEDADKAYAYARITGKTIGKDA